MLVYTKNEVWNEVWLRAYLGWPEVFSEKDISLLQAHSLIYTIIPELSVCLFVCVCAHFIVVTLLTVVN